MKRALAEDKNTDGVNALKTTSNDFGLEIGVGGGAQAMWSVGLLQELYRKKSLKPNTVPVGSSYDARRSHEQLTHQEIKQYLTQVPDQI